MATSKLIKSGIEYPIQICFALCYLLIYCLQTTSTTSLYLSVCSYPYVNHCQLSIIFEHFSHLTVIVKAMVLHAIQTFVEQNECSLN
jgi:hypothetical protein